MKRPIAAILLCIVGSAQASTLTFEGCTPDFSPTIACQGYDFVSADVMTFGQYEIGNFALFWSSIDSLAMSASNGLAFSLQSLVLNDPSTLDYLVTGYLFGGGTVQQTANAGAGFVTVDFDAGWQNLQSIQIVSTNVGFTAIDNIVVSTVPIPAAIWLFASGLGLLGWMRSRVRA